MIEIIDKLPNWLVISLFILLVIIIVFIIVALFIAIIGGREIKIGHVTIGKKETSEEKDKKTKEDKQNGEKITWTTLEKEILIMKEKLVSDQYIPSLIVGIGRGGAVVSALLSGSLGNIPIIVIDRVYKWDKDGRKDKMLFDNIDLSEFNSKILLVAGELHTGNTAKMYLQYFKEIQSSEVKMYSFFKEKFPAFQPEYFSIEDDKADILLPWMITENYKRQSLKNENSKS